MSKESNVVWQERRLKLADREKRNQHKGAIVWLTGLSASGKTTIAYALEEELFKRGVHCYSLDGDNVRHGLNKDLGFSHEDRTENIRRIGEVAKLIMDSGAIVTTSFISPYRHDRQIVRDLVKEGQFIEVFVDCPLEVCEQRDPKGLYKKARTGKIEKFTGISDPYEAPEQPEIHLHTDQSKVKECVCEIIDFLNQKDILSSTYVVK